MTAVQIHTFTGHTISAHFEAVARLRIAVFREWPYLYDGHLAYEQQYLQTLGQAPGSVLVLAIHSHTGEVVGASTGLPLVHETSNIRAPWEAASYQVKDVFYYSESVLLPAYRGQGIGLAFFAAREAHARQLGGFTTATFCAVERPDTHPLRPPGYQPLNQFWEKRGFEPTPLYCQIDWQDVDQPHETTKRLRFWSKSLRK